MADLKEYVQRALSLEKEVYIQETILKNHTDALNEHQHRKAEILANRPVKPEKRIPVKKRVEKQTVNETAYNVKAPIPPKKPEVNAVGVIFFGVLLMIDVIMTIMFLVLCVFWLFLLGVGLAIPMINVILEIREKYTNYNILLEKYDRDMEEYPRKKKEASQRLKAETLRQENIFRQKEHQAEENYKEELEKADREYEKARKEYSKKIKEYNELKNLVESAEKRLEENLLEQQKLLREIKEALEEHYAQDIIYPKYRYFIAVASICEYLSSGRCSSLEGSDGAYNIFETELRQNLIVNQLASISGNVEQVRSNQYLLYNELQDADNIIRSKSASMINSETIPTLLS